MKFKNQTILIAVSGQDTEEKDALDALRCLDSVRRGLIHLGAKPEALYVQVNDFLNPRLLLEKIRRSAPAGVFNLFEGFAGDSGKEAEFAAILERSGVPFTGNSAKTLSLCLNKQKVKNILTRAKINVPRGRLIKKIEDLKKLRADPPIFIKPCAEDASIGIDAGSLVWEKQKLRSAVISRLDRFPAGLIVEEFIPGKEYGLGFLGNKKYELIGVSEMDYARTSEYPPFLSYEAKWDTGSVLFRKLMPSYTAKIDPGQKKKMVSIARIAAARLGCQGYFRVDLRERGGDFFVLDVNPNPDINVDSGFMKQAKSSGYDFESVLKKILNVSCGFRKE